MTNEEFKKAVSIAYEISLKDTDKDKEEINVLIQTLKELTDECCDEYDHTSHLFLGVFKKLMNRK